MGNNEPILGLQMGTVLNPIEKNILPSVRAIYDNLEYIIIINN